jgi:hypothetical protein
MQVLLICLILQPAGVRHPITLDPTFHHRLVGRGGDFSRLKCWLLILVLQTSVHNLFESQSKPQSTSVL